jgi:hypothetical protein
MGTAQKNLAVVGVLVASVGGGLWITQGDRRPAGHATGEAVISQRLHQLQERRDQLWGEGMDCTPVLFSLHMQSLDDLGMGLDGTVRIADPEHDRVMQYDGVFWEDHGLVVDLRVECVGEDGNVVVERSAGPLLPDTDVPDFGSGWSVKPLSPADDGLSSIGEYFPPAPILTNTHGPQGDWDPNRIAAALAVPDNDNVDMTAPDVGEQPDRREY